MAEEKHNVFTEMLAFRKAFDQPKKDGNNPQFRSDYVTLDAIYAAIDKAIKENDIQLTYTQYTETNEQGMEYIFTEIMTTDETKVYRGSAIISARQVRGQGWQTALDPQANGSGQTYARRYSLAMVFGIASEIDDDGNLAQPKDADVEEAHQQNKKPSNPLNSKFGVLKNKIVNNSNIDEQTFFHQMSTGLNMPIHDFYAFAKLDDQTKQNVLNWLEGQVK
ncbi:ERF family protein [Weissella minor]|uniref:ERF family protein n=1 Tax=Weissella minor TaxID=1620 RepID=UPI003AF2ABA1